MNIRLTPDQKVKILNSVDTVKVMQQILLRENKIRRNQEHFWVIGLNNANKILFIELVALGTANRVHITPSEVFRMAIYKLAIKLILVHNHPSGELTPSGPDKNLTDHMMKSGAMLKIDVLDHIIITDTSFFSFAEAGIMDQLHKNGRYELIDKDKAELKELVLEAERDREKKRVARKMKLKGYSIEEIMDLTELNRVDIKRLK